MVNICSCFLHISNSRDVADPSTFVKCKALRRLYSPTGGNRHFYVDASATSRIFPPNTSLNVKWRMPPVGEYQSSWPLGLRKGLCEYIIHNALSMQRWERQKMDFACPLLKHLHFTFHVWKVLPCQFITLRAAAYNS